MGRGLSWKGLPALGKGGQPSDGYEAMCVVLCVLLLAVSPTPSHGVQCRGQGGVLERGRLAGLTAAQVPAKCTVFSPSAMSEAASAATMQSVHAVVDTELTADAVETCPVPGRGHVVAVGTYQLDEETRQKRGRVYAAHVRRSDDSGDGGGDDATVDVQLAGHVESEAVLDMKWSQAGLLATAAFSGSLATYRLNDDDMFEVAWQNGVEKEGEAPTLLSLVRGC